MSCISVCVHWVSEELRIGHRLDGLLDYEGYEGNRSSGSAGRMYDTNCMGLTWATTNIASPN